MGERQNNWKKRNRAAMNEYRRRWMKAHPEKRKVYRKKELLGHRDEMNAYRRRYRKYNPEYGKQRTRAIRMGALLKYGNKCACCGETTFEFLSFDHINGKSKEERKEMLVSGQKFAAWLYKNDIQPDIQILCHNCNQSLGHYGFCPHRPEVTRPISHRNPRKP